MTKKIYVFEDPATEAEFKRLRRNGVAAGAFAGLMLGAGLVLMAGFNQIVGVAYLGWYALIAIIRAQYRSKISDKVQRDDVRVYEQ